MQTIHKYKLEIKDTQTIKMPNKADLISIQQVNGEICIYARVNTEETMGLYTIDIRGTGQDLGDVSPETHLYAGTVVQTHKAHEPLLMDLVWHVFLNMKVEKA